MLLISCSDVIPDILPNSWDLPMSKTHIDVEIPLGILHTILHTINMGMSLGCLQAQHHGENYIWQYVLS